MVAYILHLILLSLLLFLQANAATPTTPEPQPWPLQFHSVLYINASGSLQVVQLWYDWPNGRNFNIIQRQLGNLLYDLEWNNGTSFYYDLQAKTCRTISFEVGILRPNWLDGATYLGVEQFDGFTCNVWTKADFITYWEDIKTKRPVHWLFFSGMSVHVITFEVGAVLEDSMWQAPVYCFSKKDSVNVQSISPPRIPMTKGESPVRIERLRQAWVKEGWRNTRWTRWFLDVDTRRSPF